MSHSAFTSYDISEVYSNASGTVQFVELSVGNVNSANHLTGFTLRSSNGIANNFFTFDGDLWTTQTANTHILIGTTDVAAVFGVMPDFIVPEYFLFSSNSTISLGISSDIVSYVSLPDDGSSLKFTTYAGSPDSQGTADPTPDPEDFPDNPASPVSPLPPAAIDDEFTGTGGNDTVNAQSGDDVADGLAGNDSLLGAYGADTLIGGDGADTLIGGFGADSILGQGDGDVLRGSAGLDTLRGGAGTDDIRGGADSDQIFGGGDADTLAGALGADTLRGALGNDNLGGGQGNDDLGGGQGDDTLQGGQGTDILAGGLGADHFVFTGSGADRVQGFNADEGDVLELDADFFSGFAPGSVPAANFVAGVGAIHATYPVQPMLIYSIHTGDGFTTGVLTYDADGGNDAMMDGVSIASFPGGPAISASDFIVT